MPNLNTDRIFNESSEKVLFREFNNLKKDYNKLNALRYKQCYENESLSFLLEHANFIFPEPYYGYDFFRNIMENCTIPVYTVEPLYDAVSKYYRENVENMSETQKSMYSELRDILERKYNSLRNTIALWEYTTEFSIDKELLYNEIYRMQKINDSTPPILYSAITESDDVNLIDTLTVTLEFPSLQTSLYSYLESCYVENPKTPEDYALNTFTTNMIQRMLRDSYFKERVEKIPNMNLRHFILGLGGVKDVDTVNDLLVEKVSYDPHFATAESSVNRIYEDDCFSEFLEEENNKIRYDKLLCEKAIVDVDLGFSTIDYLAGTEKKDSFNSIVERLCVESSSIHKIPTEPERQLKMLSDLSDNLGNEIVALERYFSRDGLPSKAVADSIGYRGKDSAMDKKAREANEVPSELPNPGKPQSPSFFVPKRKREEESDSDDKEDSISPSSDSKDTNDEDDDNNDALEKIENDLEAAFKDFHDKLDIDSFGDDEIKVTYDKKELNASEIGKINAKVNGQRNSDFTVTKSEKDGKVIFIIKQKDFDEDRKKKEDAKKRKTDKYANMDEGELDSDFKEFVDWYNESVLDDLKAKANELTKKFRKINASDPRFKFISAFRESHSWDRAEVICKLYENGKVKDCHINFIKHGEVAEVSDIKKTLEEEGLKPSEFERFCDEIVSSVNNVMKVKIDDGEFEGKEQPDTMLIQIKKKKDFPEKYHYLDFNARFFYLGKKNISYKEESTYYEADGTDSKFDNSYQKDTFRDDSDKKKKVKEKKPKYAKVEKPDKRPFLQRVQNAALDANVKFKKVVAQGRRVAQDARNAGKALTKIPMNIAAAIKKTKEDWEEADDNKRKEYILKPGYRKKYFKALRLAILHYAAFMIDPLLNIVLAICHGFGIEKDARMRNELIRELQAEIKVTDEKIEDARKRDDDKQKYVLMRTKEKLEAELTRVSANARTI